MVCIDLANAKADCECNGFSYQRVLCSHALLVMRHVGMEPFLPKHYILKRWTRDANANTKKGINDCCFEGNDPQSVKRNALAKRMDTIMSMPNVLTTSYDLACGHLDDLIDVLQGVHGEDDEDEPKLKVIKKEEDMKFSDPPVSQCKGRRTPHRFKPPADVKDAKKMRTCSYCHKKEGHNMRKCPKVNDCLIVCDLFSLFNCL
jgi:hypothetical protein